MQPAVKAVLVSWSIPPAATFAIVLAALAYLRGAWLLRRAGYPNLPALRIAAFLLGLFALWFALASPLDTFSSFVLTAHMLQHMTLMMVAPPLLLLGEPLVPIVRGMPRFAAREFAGPFLNWPVAGRIGLFLTHPMTALVLMGAVMFIWHVPGPYELAVRSGAWHWFEHACFFFVSLIFWWPVIQPWPSHSQWPRWAIVPYLVVADLQNTALSAVLVFSDRLLYPSYGTGPSLFGFPPPEDQAAAGAIMWVVGSLVFLIPAALIAMQCLSRKRSSVAIAANARQFHSAEPQDARSWRKILFADFFTSPQFQVLSFVVLFLIVSAALILLSRIGSDDDDQIFLGSQESGPFTIALYGPEGSIPSGPASFSILVQDRASHQLLLDGDVKVSVRNAADRSTESQQYAALLKNENRLLYGVDVDLDSVGPQLLEVSVEHGSDRPMASFPIMLVKPQAESSFPWSYGFVVVIAILLTTVYFLRHRPPESARAAISTS
jgi:cytochrome c oxidase assembly factor CtaG